MFFFPLALCVSPEVDLVMSVPKDIINLSFCSSGTWSVKYNQRLAFLADK